jgi:serine/threonine-protein kinase
LIGVQQRLQWWAGRSAGNASQWADTVLSPRAADPDAYRGGQPMPDSQYLSGFDSQFVDDPALADAAAGPAQAEGRPGAADAAPAHVPAAPSAPRKPRLQAEPEAAAGRPPDLPSHFGRYTVKARLPSSAAGALYEAWDPVRSCPVTVCTVQLPPRPDAGFLADLQTVAAVKARLEERVLETVRAAVPLRHPHIMSVLDAGHSPSGVYVATERVQGRDMGKALAQGWRPRPSLAAQIMRRVAEALAHAHEKGLVHGDIRPANIFLDDKAQPKLQNFGIAQVARSQGLDQLQPSVESLRYLAPEQLPGGIADARTDIRAVGVVLYELLAMAPAFDGKTAGDVARAVLANRPKPIHELHTNSPRSLAAIAIRATASNPEHRFSSATEMARELAAWSERHAARKARMAQGTLMNWPGRQTSRGARAHRTLTWVVGGAVGGLALLWLVMPVALSGLAFVSQAMRERAVAAQASSTPVARPELTSGLSPSARAERDAAYAAKRFGVVALEVSPGAQVSVSGIPVGRTPPMTHLKLPVGRQSILLRSEGFDPYQISVEVRHEQPVELRHRFTR